MCSNYINEKCKSGFKVSTGCWATGNLEKSTIHTVECIDIEKCGIKYGSNGGMPKFDFK